MKRNRRKPDKETTIKIIFFFIAGFAAPLTFVSILDVFEVIPKGYIANPVSFLIYVFCSIILGLLRIIDWLDSQIPVSVASEPEEPLIDIISKADREKRYNQVIFLGNVISDYLWYCGKKELRIKIASFLLSASEKKNDRYTHARVLIEDLGNTYTEIEGRENTKKAIYNINEGIKIANENNFHYLSARGYRNLACVYAYKYSLSNKESSHDLDQAKKCLEAGRKYLDKIADPWQKTDAEAALLYAECRVLQNSGENVKASGALKKAIDLYKQYTDDSEKGIIAKERLKKVFRELGYIFIDDNKAENNENNNAISREERRDAGFELLINALDICEEDNDVSNFCQIATCFLKNASDREIDKYARPLVSKCKAFLSQLDPNSKLYFELNSAISEVKKHWII